VITRPEICSKAILQVGRGAEAEVATKDRYRERIVAVAVTEPNAGSGVAAVQTSARKTEGGYLINARKRGVPLPSRDTIVLLARTGRVRTAPRA